MRGSRGATQTRGGQGAIDGQGQVGGFFFGAFEVTEIEEGDDIEITITPGGAGGGYVMSISATATVVAEPDKQLVYGTGAAVDSEANFIYDYTNNAVGLGIASPQLNTGVGVQQISIGGTNDTDGGYGQLNLVGQWTNGLAMGRVSFHDKITGGTLRELFRIDGYTDNTGPPSNGGLKFYTRRGFHATFAGDGHESLMIDPLGNVRAGYDEVHGPDAVDGYFGIPGQVLAPQSMVPTLSDGAFYNHAAYGDLFMYGGDGINGATTGWHKPNEMARWTYRCWGTAGVPIGDLELRNFGAVHVIRHTSTGVVWLHSGGYDEPGKLQVIKNNTGSTLTVKFYPNSNFLDANSTAVPTPVTTTIAAGATSCFVEGNSVEDAGLSDISYHLLYTTDLSKMIGVLPIAGIAPGADGDVLRTTAGAVAWGAEGTAAPADGQFLTLALNATMTGERVFTPSTGLTATDGGANGNYTVTANIATGVNGGQTAIGDTAANGNLTLQGTAHATRTTSRVVCADALRVPDGTGTFMGMQFTSETTGFQLNGVGTVRLIRQGGAGVLMSWSSSFVVGEGRYATSFASAGASAPHYTHNSFDTTGMRIASGVVQLCIAGAFGAEVSAPADTETALLIRKNVGGVFSLSRVSFKDFASLAGGDLVLTIAA